MLDEPVIKAGRMDTPVPNGTTRRRKPKETPATEAAAEPRPRPARPPRDAYGIWWANAGVAITLCLSAWLNILAFARHGKAEGAAWVLGVALPLLVLIFSRAGAWAYQRNQRPVAYVAAGAVVMMLALSIQHVSESVSVISGESLLTASLLGCSIDLGLVACELMVCLKPTKS